MELEVYSSEKWFHFHDAENKIDEVCCVEYFSPHYSAFVWPSSILLSTFLAFNRRSIAGKNIVELGSGLGLPSLLCSKLNANKVWLSDRCDEPTLFELWEEEFRVNNIASCGKVNIIWGESVAISEKVDIILGADIFYDPDDFDNIVFTLRSMLELNPQSVFYTVYHERSKNRTLQPYLELYGLTARPIEISSFINPSHEIGCHFECIDLKKDLFAESNPMTFDSLFMFQVQINSNSM